MKAKRQPKPKRINLGQWHDSAMPDQHGVEHPYCERHWRGYLLVASADVDTEGGVTYSVVVWGGRGGTVQVAGLYSLPTLATAKRKALLLAPFVWGLNHSKAG